MDYKMISADDHLDLQYLPTNLWTERLPKALRDRAPHIEERDGGSVWVCDGEVWGRWAGTRRPMGPKALFNAFDRGGVDETELRPAQAALRLADMDRDGVEAQVMFGPVAAMAIADPELRIACIQAYNDWLIEFGAAAPNRLLGVAILPPEDPAGARAEVYPVGKAGRAPSGEPPGGPGDTASPRCGLGAGLDSVRGDGPHPVLPCRRVPRR